MKKRMGILAAAGVGVLLVGVSVFFTGRAKAASMNVPSTSTVAKVAPEPDRRYNDFEVQVLVNGRPLEEYAARGRTYVEALEGAEYEVRIRNPLPVRVAVALSVDGLNSINARHTTAWLASKWVIGPYQTIHITGWQVSSERARHFYFTTESVGRIAIAVLSNLVLNAFIPIGINGGRSSARSALNDSITVSPVASSGPGGVVNVVLYGVVETETTE